MNQKCPLGKCDGSQRISIETIDGPQTVYCDCLPDLRDCSEGHIRITFRADHCPLCATLVLLAKKSEEVKYWIGQETSWVQKLNQKRTENQKEAHDHAAPEAEAPKE